MTMIYSNPAREQEAGSVPDVEVWEHIGIGHNTDPRMQCAPTIDSSLPECSGNGWYWRKLDGTGPFGGIMGPFDTEAEAVADAQADASVDESETDGYGDHNANPDDGAPRDITGDVGPLDSSRKTPMYSFEVPATSFWQGAYAALIAAGSTDAQAIEWLQSKHPRWMLNARRDKVQELGRALTAEYIAKNGTAIDSDELPPCVLAMGCYCAGHARGNPASAPCDTSETERAS